MSKKRASLLTASSLLALSKVSCSSSSRNSSISIKSLDGLSRRISTATERLDFENPNGYKTNNPSDSGSDFNGVNEKPAAFGQKGLNPSQGLRGSPRNDCGNKPVGEVRSFDVQKEQNPNGLYWDHAGVGRDSVRNQNGNDAMRNVRNSGGYNGQNDVNMQWNATRIGPEGARGFQQSCNGVSTEGTQGVQWNLDGLNQNHGGNYRESSANVFKNYTTQQNDYSNGNGAYGYGNGLSQQNSSTASTQYSWGANGFNGGNRNAQNQSWGSYQGGHTQMMHKGSSFNAQVQSQFQENLDWKQTQNISQFQQNPNVRSPEMYRQNLQNPMVGQYQTNSNYPNRLMASQVLSNPRAQIELADAADGNAPESKESATVEELDELCREGKLKDAVEVLSSLANKGIVVDVARLLNLLRECGDAEALQEVKAVHEHIIASVSPIEVGTYNKIIEMYAKCGSMDDASNVFNKMPEKNLETWDTMIRWLAKNCLGEDAIDMFSRFKEEGNKPNGQIFIGVFSACAVLGDVNEGLLHLESMDKNYGIVPSMEHYVAVVEMLSTTGYLDEAMEFIEGMPIEPNVDIWETLMNLSRIHGSLELGDRCAEIVEQLDATRLNEQSKAGLIPVKASDIAKEKQKKMLGSQNPLEIRSRVHEYRAGDTSHPENERIYALLRGLKAHMVEMGYIPETRFVLHDVDQESKEEALLSHSERLAFAHGLLTTSARSSIRVIKNLRVCVDCHNALKIISKIVGREFIMRDAKRFHHLKDGVCSCRDYW